MVICPVCLSIFGEDLDPKDECPYCNLGELIEYEIFQERMTVSFMDSLKYMEDPTEDYEKEEGSSNDVDN